jgi:hypothetical protein
MLWHICGIPICVFDTFSDSDLLFGESFIPLPALHFVRNAYAYIHVLRNNHAVHVLLLSIFFGWRKQTSNIYTTLNYELHSSSRATAPVWTYPKHLHCTDSLAFFLYLYIFKEPNLSTRDIVKGALGWNTFDKLRKDGII